MATSLIVYRGTTCQSIANLMVIALEEIGSQTGVIFSAACPRRLDIVIRERGL